ncbi:C-X-C motif chemokine 16-like [Rhinatrema bivittatum]|uniref:C-X-C motif chemokine 16-like n=1 Tax=Rhinatrema bivittatum TaxID=194408 RepID=UPI00112C4D2F|nr:C-X-C motif chemokine 16-like [Rhinatrema bivittatum]
MRCGWKDFPPSLPGIRFLLLCFQLSRPAFCQIGVNSALCSCPRLENPPNQSTMAQYSFQLKNYDICPNNIIRFNLKKSTVCGTAFEDWVQKLKTCIDTNNFTECRRKVPKTNMDVKIISTTVTTMRRGQSVATESETQTDVLRDLTVTASAISYRQDHETDLHLQVTGSMDGKFHDLAQIPFTTSVPTEEGKMNQMRVAIISLLGISFILIGITTFVICRKRAAFWKSKSEIHYWDEQRIQMAPQKYTELPTSPPSQY